MFAFPMHARSFEASFDHVFVRTLYHARTDRPALFSELRVLHQRLSFAEVSQMATFFFLLGSVTQQTVSHTQERAGTTMFENMQRAFQHFWRKTYFGFL